MKPHVADWQTRIHAVRIEATNGAAVRFVEYPHDLVMSGVVYQADSGYEFSGMSATSSLAPSVIDLEGVLDSAGIGRDQLASGVWDNARCYLFATSWANPVEDEEPLGKFILGKVRIQDDRYVAELMHLIDALNQSVGRSHSALCGWTLFDQNLEGETFPRSLCQLSMSDYLETGTVTDVTSRAVFRDSARTEPDDWFGVGSIRFTSGDNAGLRSQEIKSYAADGTIELFLPFHYPVQVGDQYEIIPGCRKRRVEDCAGKFDNAINHGGFDRIPTQSVYTDIGTGGA